MDSSSNWPGGENRQNTQGEASQSFIAPSLHTDSAGIETDSNYVPGPDYRIRDDAEAYPEGTQSDDSGEQPSIEQIQQLYYRKGQKELDALQLLDLSPLASWKLSSYKKGFGLSQLRNDTPETFWQSDGSAGNNMEHQTSDCGQLSHPHYVVLQFSKKVSLERISIFTNYQLDESYTPLRIKIMAGSSNWDLTEVCVVNFERPVGWSHIIFKGVRGDGLLKCFVVKIIILANHQDGKDSHVRAIRCFGKKPAAASSMVGISEPAISKDVSLNMGLSSLSGILLNTNSFGETLGGSRRHDLLGGIVIEEEDSQEEGAAAGTRVGEHEEEAGQELDQATTKILKNVNEVLGFNSGFDSLEFRSVSSIR